MAKLTEKVIHVVDQEFNTIVDTYTESMIVDEFPELADVYGPEFFEQAAVKIEEKFGPSIYTNVKEIDCTIDRHKSEYGSLYGSYESGYGSSFSGDD